MFNVFRLKLSASDEKNKGNPARANFSVLPVTLKAPVNVTYDASGSLPSSGQPIIIYQ
jgi:hypothetical protein